MIYVLEPDPHGIPPAMGGYEWVRTITVLMKMFGGPGRWPSGN